jgi:hypothetical protein
MKIALVIPTYKPHFIYLQSLCKNIASQTRLPDLVVIRASSCDTEAGAQLAALSKQQWPFPLQVLDTPTQQFQAQNRNEGAAAVPPDFDILSFFDSDDLMHPRRLEILERVFLQGAEAVFHGCVRADTSTDLEWETFDAPPSHVWDSFLLQKESAIQSGNQIISRSVILKAYPGQIPEGKEITFFRPIPMDEALEECLDIHYGHLSILQSLLKIVRFDEEALGYEDAKITSDIVFQRRKTASIRAKLSFYRV